MSQSFKLTFDAMRQGDPTQTGDADNGDHFPGPSNTRNVTFVWLTGRSLFLNYAYLVSGEYDPEANRIVLSFTTHIVTLSGVHLDKLFEALTQHIPKTITATDSRYAQLEDADIPLVHQIDVQSNT